MSTPAPVTQTPPTNPPAAAIDWRRVPAILLVGLRFSGKTTTLNSWKRALQYQGEIQGSNVMPPRWHTGATQGTDRVIQHAFLFGRHPLRVIDIPGELVNQNIDTSGDYWTRLMEQCGEIGGAVICSVPPIDPGLAPGAYRRGFVNQRARYEQSNEHSHDLATAQFRLRKSIDFCHTFVGSRQATAEIPIVIQIGFADVVSFGDSAEQHQKEVGELAPLYQALWPNRVAAAELPQPRRINERGHCLARIDASVRRVFSSLLGTIAKGGSHDEYFCAAISNVNEDGLGSTRNCAIGFLYVADHLAGAVIQRAWRRQRTRMWFLVGGITVAVATVGGVTAAVVGDRNPEAIQPLGAVFCSNPVSLSIERRCRCLPLMTSRPDDLDPSLKNRLYALMPYRDACISQLNKGAALTPTIATALLRTEIACAMIQPATLCPARLRELFEKGALFRDGGSEVDYYPAVSAAEIEFSTWVYRSLNKQPGADMAMLKGAMSGASAEFSELRRLLAETADSERCAKDWIMARSSDDWRAVTQSCARGASYLAPDLQAFLDADLPQPGLLGKRPAVVGQVTALVDAAGPADGCQGPRGLGALVTSSPLPDGLTFGNLAAQAPTPDDFRRWITQATGAPSGHTLWLELLSPYRTSAERDEFASKLDATALQNLAMFIRQPFWLIGRTKPLGEVRSARTDGRAPRLPKSKLGDAICALSGRAWPEDVALVPLAVEDTALARANLAMAMMTWERPAKDPETQRCVISATLTLSRSPQPEEGARFRTTLISQLRSAAANSALATPSADLSCQITAEIEANREADALIEALAKRDTKRAARCAARAYLRRLGRKEIEAATELFPTIRAGEPELADLLEKASSSMSPTVDPDAGTGRAAIAQLRARLPAEAFGSVLNAAEASQP